MKYIAQKRLTVFLIFIVLGIDGFVAWSSAQSKNVEQVSIENKTRSFIVESVKELSEKNDRSEIEVIFRNNYDKPIASYRVRVSEEFEGKTDVSAMERGGLIVSWVLNSGETKIEKFIVNSNGKTHLTIAAVIFEDGTGDGENVELNRLKEIRVGVKMGFQKIVPILQDVEKTSESSSPDTAIQSLEEKINQLDDKDIPDSSKRGYALAKSYVSMELKDIREAKNRNSNFNIATEVAAKLTEIESALIKLSVNLPSNRDGKRRQK